MKTILVPTEDDDAMSSALETALILARRCDSYIEGFALRWKITEFVSADMMGAACLPFWFWAIIGDSSCVRPRRSTREG
jgi:hypothetical protein